MMRSSLSRSLSVIAIVIPAVTAVLTFLALDLIGARELANRCLRHLQEMHCPERAPR